MMVADIQDRMTYAEYQGWVAYFNEQNAPEDPIDLTQATPEQVMGMFS